MLLRGATVLTVHPDRVQLELDEPATCAGCRGHGCGIGPLLRPWRAATASWHLPLPAGMRLRAGDRVQVCLPARPFLAGIGLAYGLPLAGLGAGAIAVAWLLPAAPDPAVAAGACFGLIIALLVPRGRRRARLSPTIRPLGRRSPP